MSARYFVPNHCFQTTSGVHTYNFSAVSPVCVCVCYGRSYPDQVADSRLHGGHGRGEIRDGFTVHLSLFVHDHQMRDLLSHGLQNTLYRFGVKHRHDDNFRWVALKRKTPLCIQTHPFPNALSSPVRTETPRTHRHPLHTQLSREESHCGVVTSDSPRNRSCESSHVTESNQTKWTLLIWLIKYKKRFITS